MNFRVFLIGISITFGLPWVFAIAFPYVKMSNLEAVEFKEAKDGFDGVYQAKRPGRLDGARIYAANGCAVCHTQLIRPSYAGSEIYRDDWAGLPADPANGIEDSRRETNPYDFDGEDFALIGQSRVGPDLSNVAIRAARTGEEKGMSAKDWLLWHLYDPREATYWWSVCPSSKYLFKKSGAQTAALSEGPLTGVKPSSDAIALVDYLLSMRKNDPIPASVDPRAKPN